MRQQRALLSSKKDTAKAINYLFNRGATFTRFLDDGRVCLTNNAAERALQGVAVGRKNWTFAGSDTGGDRAASAYALIETRKMNDVDPQAWLADVLARLPDHPAKKIAETPQNTLPQTICAASGMSNFLFTPTFRIVAGCQLASVR
jgi:transposase